MLSGMKAAGLLDRLSMALSAVCLVHCLASALLLGVASAVAGAAFGSSLHELGLLLAVPLGVFALGRGILVHGFVMPASVGGLGLGVMAGALTLPHGGAEIGYTILGVSILALGHDLNLRATS